MRNAASYLLIYTCHFPFISYQYRAWHSRLASVDALCTQHSGTGCVYRGESVCQCLCKTPTPHTGIREENERYTVNFILESNPSITAEVAWAPMCLALPGDHISSAMPENSIWSAWPPSLDHGWCLSFFSPSLSICAWVATKPWAPINPMMPGCGWYGDQTGHRESCDSQVKGGIDFLIRSSTQIELQLNFKLSPSLVYPHD